MEDLKYFELNIDGEIKKCKLVTSLALEEIGLNYAYFYVVEEDDNDDTEKQLFAFRIEKDENGKDIIIPIDTDEERNLAFKVYSDAYNLSQNSDIDE